MLKLSHNPKTQKINIWWKDEYKLNANSAEDQWNENTLH